MKRFAAVFLIVGAAALGSPAAAIAAPIGTGSAEMGGPFYGALPSWSTILAAFAQCGSAAIGNTACGTGTPPIAFFP
ncbi:hypothetical protein O1W68_14215 [Rhodococcus sp. H36-A4]|uniref:hypothetical protein n=1 Tax=Rhodococcus sp. H36-A4 TaxID=3004353 RepID=UPI0022AFC653|nr:hypothetical protein [Rhodococcus sp. H36-A4]MCZ4079101.1 hypothetical protein [Rhodococcus sp. H36-A4]